MHRHLVRSASAASALVLVALLGAPGTGSAATVTGACPTSATESPTAEGLLPPFAAGTTITALVGCTTPYVATGEGPTDVHLTYGDLGLVDDGCSTLSALSLTSTGTPAGFGWGIIAYNTSTNAVIPPTAGDDGVFQVFGATAGQTVSEGGATFRSPSAQPASGSYSVIGDLDPTAITLADLVAGRLGIAAVVLNPDGPDTLTSLTVSVTTDSSACEATTSTSTSTTIATPTTAAPAAAPAVEATPAFTG